MKNSHAFHSAHSLRGCGLTLSGALLTGLVSASAQASGITEYSIPTTGSFPIGVTSGPDGNVWFTEQDGDKIGRITPAGTITEFSLPTSGSSPVNITAGPDGNLWFTEYAGNGIGRITTAGVVSEFPLPVASSHPSGITLGPDGNLWFAEARCSACVFGSPGSLEVIGQITPAGAITEFSTPNSLASGEPLGIASGPDGNLWFTEGGGANIGRITPAGVVTEFPVPVQNGSDDLPVAITNGPDGNLWFAIGTPSCIDLPPGCSPPASPIGKITPAGVITEFPLASNGGLAGITRGPDGNLWFTDYGDAQIGTITPAGVITEYAVPTAGSTPFGIVTGADGNLWFAESAGNKIGKIAATAGITISSGFTGNWFDTSESGHGFSIEVLPGNQMLAEWYVFAPNGGQSWIVATGPIAGNTAVLQGWQPVGPGGRFPPNFNSSQLQNQPWGTITFTFTDCNDGHVSWQPTANGYTSGSIPITRLTMPAGLSCP
jgi:streptogramin lyase